MSRFVDFKAVKAAVTAGAACRWSWRLDQWPLRHSFS